MSSDDFYSKLQRHSQTVWGLQIRPVGRERELTTGVCQQRQPKLGHPLPKGPVFWQRGIDYLDAGQQFQQNRACLHTRFQSIESVLPSWMNGYPGKYPRFQFSDLEQVIVGDKEPGKIGAGCAIFLVDIVAS